MALLDKILKMLFSVGRCSTAGLVLLRMALLKKTPLGMLFSVGRCSMADLVLLRMALSKKNPLRMLFSVGRCSIAGLVLLRMALLNKLLLGCCSLQHVGLLQGLARVGPKTPGRLHLTLGPTVFVRFDPIRCMGTMHLTGLGVYSWQE